MDLIPTPSPERACWKLRKSTLQTIVIAIAEWLRKRRRKLQLEPPRNDSDDKRVGMARLNEMNKTPIITLLLAVCLGIRSAVLRWDQPGSRGCCLHRRGLSMRERLCHHQPFHQSRLGHPGYGKRRQVRLHSGLRRGRERRRLRRCCRRSAAAKPGRVCKDGAVYVFDGSANGLSASANWFTGSGLQGSWFGHWCLPLGM